MSTSLASAGGHAGHDDHHDHHHHINANKIYGFWLYLMTDLILFGTLFATYAVLHVGTAGGPTPRDIFELDFVLVETFLLLISSVTFGFAMIAAHKGNVSGVKNWLWVTFAFGAGFIAMELYEFNHLIHAGHGPQVSAFLSAFFTLVGTHGLHVTVGLIWILLMIVHLSRHGLSQPATLMRLSCLSLFWHFLDIVWICVYTMVYLTGVAQ
ncbi:cytochrome o ubiquinol oxidase subunit III [Amphibiibacter pelophylacis]|uniref:Cytochrome o ubiquinol oxidase subunit III n=1 Tax=Amphibiibacter pelophylacis TaxID=1799477 RepID=A0ACC6P413_9BURK